MIPDHRSDNTTTPNDTPHLGYGLGRIWNKVQDQQCHGPIEAGVAKGERGSICLLDDDPGIGISFFGGCNKHRPKVDRLDFLKVTVLCELEGQAASAAADIEYLLARRNAHKLNE